MSHGRERVARASFLGVAVLAGGNAVGRIPIFTVLFSAWLDDEPVGVELILGGLLVLAGVYIGALRHATLKPWGAEAP